MTPMKAFLNILFLTFFLPITSIGQELNCQVDVSVTASVQNRTQEQYNNLKEMIQDFMNNTQWTSDKFSTVEKIECNISINVTKEVGSNSYSAEAVISAVRPIFNSTYTSNIFYIRDPNFSFIFTEGEPLIFNEGSYSNNLTSLLSFYAFMIIAADYDSYKLYGGSKYYSKAQNVVNNVNTEGTMGWTQADGDYSRFNIIDRIMRPDHEILRKFNYEYHRHGLDVMYDNVEKAKKKIYATFNYLEKLNNDVPGTVILTILFNAKRSEFANVIKEFSTDKKNLIIPKLNNLDINNRGAYNKSKK